MDTLTALGRNTVDCSDEQLAKIQAIILAACLPLATLWSNMDVQEIKGKPEEIIQLRMSSE